MEFTAKQLAEVLNGTVEGDPQAKVSSFAKIEHGKPGQLCFFANPKYEHYVYTSRASVLLVNADFTPKEAVTPTLVRVPNAYDALAQLLDTLRAHRDAGELADLYITNFVYEKLCENKRFVRHYTKNLPAGRFFGWKEVKRFHTSNCLLMHSLMYRTDKLRESGMVLPEHTFYVDNIYAYKPLPLMQKLFYLDVDLYRYFIGREDQSVSAANIVRRYKQQIRVMKEMIVSYPYEQLASMDKGLFRYMKHDLSVIMTLTVMFTTGGKDELPERKEALRELWQFIKERDKKMYNFLRHFSYTSLVNWMPFRMCGSVTVLGYRYYRRRINCS